MVWLVAAASVSMLIRLSAVILWVGDSMMIVSVSRNESKFRA